MVACVYKANKNKKAFGKLCSWTGVVASPVRVVFEGCPVERGEASLVGSFVGFFAFVRRFSPELHLSRLERTLMARGLALPVQFSFRVPGAGVRNKGGAQFCFSRLAETGRVSAVPLSLGTVMDVCCWVSGRFYTISRFLAG